MVNGLDFPPTVFFYTWRTDKIIPGMGNVQIIADYFKLGTSDLLDEKLASDPVIDARILADTETIEMIKNAIHYPQKMKILFGK